VSLSFCVILERCNLWPHVANRHISISQLLSSWRYSHYDVICYWAGHAWRDGWTDIRTYVHTYICTNTLLHLIYKDDMCCLNTVQRTNCSNSAVPDRCRLQAIQICPATSLITAQIIRPAAAGAQLIFAVCSVHPASQCNTLIVHIATRTAHNYQHYSDPTNCKQRLTAGKKLTISHC